jgi:hypothetical protein
MDGELTVSHLAEHLGVSTSVMYAWVSNGKHLGQLTSAKGEPYFAAQRGGGAESVLVASRPQSPRAGRARGHIGHRLGPRGA